ncbi:MAG: glutathione ABC transporter permease GsiC [Chloroflexota bacterium]
MTRYLVRRLLLLAVTLFGVSVFVFGLIRLLPGDAITMLLQDYAYAENLDALRAKLGLDRPVYIQYWDWLSKVLRGDLGQSLRSRQPVVDELVRRLPITAELGILAMFVGLAISIPVGVLSAVKQDTFTDYVARGVAVAALAVPGFWLGTLVITFPSIWFRWTPPLQYTPLHVDPVKNLSHVIIPAAILGIGLSGTLMRLTRATMLEVLRQDYVRTAWAKGLAWRVVIFRHALKNALIPVVTVLGLQVSVLVGGSVVMEQIFVIPGMGRYLLEAIQYRDYPVVQALNLVFALVILLSNLVVDVVYAYLDPRIQYD